jgi:hypothetical protein
MPEARVRLPPQPDVERMTSPLSLAWRTDLAFARFDGEVSARGDHLCVRTPANPTWWWGNFLLFDAPPRAGDLVRWTALFEEEIERLQPASRHRAFGVDVRERFVLPPEFAQAGYTLAESTVLTLDPAQLRPRPRAPRVDARLRVLDLPRDAAAVVDKQVAVDAHRYDLDGYREFAQRQMQRYGAMQAAGRGHWFGLEVEADDGPRLVASCGLFRDPARDDAWAASSTSRRIPTGAGAAWPARWCTPCAATASSAWACARW